MCHNSSYSHPGRRVARIALAVAALAAVTVWVHVALVVVAVVVGVLALVAAVAKVVDVVGTRRAVAAHQAHVLEHQRERMRRRAVDGAPRRRTRLGPAERVALEAAAPVPAWAAVPASRETHGRYVS